jgi:hypothetical protein
VVAPAREVSSRLAFSSSKISMTRTATPSSPKARPEMGGPCEVAFVASRCSFTFTFAFTRDA